MIVSAASLFFRDVKYIVEVLLTFGIFFTPVFYDVSMFGDKGKWLIAQSGGPDSGWVQRLHRPPSIAGTALVCVQLRFCSGGTSSVGTFSSSIWSRPSRKAFDRRV